MTQLAVQDQKFMPSGEGDSNPPHGLKGSLKAEPLIGPQNIVTLSFFVLLSVIMMIVVVWLFNNLKFLRKRRVPPAELSQLSDLERLRADLNNLALPLEEHISEDDKRADWARFSSSLSVILRRAVEYRTKLPIAERTVQEISVIFGDSEDTFLKMSKNELIDMLRELDEITFAGKTGLVNQASGLLAKIKGIIRDLTAENVDHLDRKAPESARVKIFE